MDEVDTDDDDGFNEIGVPKVVLILSPPPLSPLLPKIIISGVRIETKNTTKKRQMSKKWNFLAFILLIEFKK